MLAHNCHKFSCRHIYLFCHFSVLHINPFFKIGSSSSTVILPRFPNFSPTNWFSYLGEKQLFPPKKVHLESFTTEAQAEVSRLIVILSPMFLTLKISLSISDILWFMKELVVGYLWVHKDAMLTFRVVDQTLEMRIWKGMTLHGN